MIDHSLLRENPEKIAANFARRGFHLDVAAFSELDSKVSTLQKSEEDLRAQRNKLSKQIGELMRNGGKDQAAQLQQEAGEIGDQVKQLHDELRQAQGALQDFLLGLPNLLHPDVPTGENDDDNKLVRTVGQPEVLEFNPQDHVALGELHGLMNFEQAASMAQARFVVMYGALAALHRALAQYMLSLHTGKHGYCECYLPYMLNTKAFVNTGHLPKFGDENNFFSVADTDLHLIPTAELSLGNLAADRTFAQDELPLRFVAHSPCFRREAGSYGKDTRGMLRQHQFDKVELVQIVHPDASEEALEEMVGHAEQVLKDLELPYRVVELCSKSTGNGANRTYDLEVWLPGQAAYREISSCSNDDDFQARRMKARLRSDGKKARFVHLLNGSGVAVGRALIAVMENYQDEQGNVRVPEVLRPFLEGRSVIEVPS